MTAIPAEMYSFGFNWFFNLVSLFLTIPMLCWIIIPVFYNNNLSNCYEVCLHVKVREYLSISHIKKIKIFRKLNTFLEIQPANDVCTFF